MPVDASARCALQVARERRLSVYPDEFGIEQDICDVTLWIQQKFRLTSVYIWIDRNYAQRGHEISGITVIMSSTHPDPLAPAAHEAFLALGYDILNTGADSYGYPICDGPHSRHDAFKAFARIESVLKIWWAGK